MAFGASKTSRLRAATILAAALFCVAALAGCGGGQRQDTNVKAGTWKVEVTKFGFPKRQPLGRPVNLTLTVRNVDTTDLPDLAITVEGLSEIVEQQGQATKTRPIWALNDTPPAEQTPYDSTLGQTYSLGRLAPGAEKTLTLPMTPLRRGTHQVDYAVSANLFGSGKTTFEDGSSAKGSREIAIDPTPDFDPNVFRTGKSR